MWSRGHTSLDPVKDAEQYFAFDFEQLGTYDLPAQIDGIKEVTGVDKVTYIGHNQGATQMLFALVKHEEEIKKRVNLFVALAPIA